MKKALVLTLAMLGGWLTSGTAEAQRAVAGDDVVLERLYPKTRTIELEAYVGMILNPTFVNTALAGVSARYHWSETWGLGLDIAGAQTTDRHERACVESFYNDPDQRAGATCAADDGGAGGHQQGVNLGPAYVPIRAVRSLITVSADYSLAYGKQIILYGATSHFDLRLRFGGGALTADVYDERQTLRGESRVSRGPPQTSGTGPDDTDGDGHLYGTEGRPSARLVTSPVVFGGLVEELHFWRRFFAGAELAGYLTTGLKSGIDPFLVLKLSVGTRF